MDYLRYLGHLMRHGKSKSYTLGEAEAYDKGYEDGLVAAKNTTVTSVSRHSEACLNDNPDDRCDKCNCWKIFREYCS